jgi:hypothetical protein
VIGPEMNPQLGKDYRYRDAAAWAAKARDRTVATLANIASPSKSGSFAIDMGPLLAADWLEIARRPSTWFVASTLISGPLQSTAQGDPTLAE